MSDISHLDLKKAQMCQLGKGYIIDAHKHTTRHRDEVEKSKAIGCFYCLKTFDPKEIENWLEAEDTALCPYCSIDSVIGDASGYPVGDEKFLREMNEFWFSSLGGAT